MGNKKSFSDKVAKGGGIVALAGFLTACVFNSEIVEAKGVYNSIIDDTKNTPYFQEYKKQHEIALIDAYKRGEITATELSAKLSVLESTEFVYENRDALMSEKNANTVEVELDKIGEMGQITATAATGAFAGGLVGMLGYLLSEKNRIYKKDSSKNVSQNSGCSCADCKSKLSAIDESEFEF